jgi:quercetin dioxygenase-like cupin family protein
MRPVLIASMFCLGVTLAAPPSSRAGVPYAFSYTEQARGVAAHPGTLDVTAGWSAVVQTHVLEPGFRAPWHRHPDRSLVIMKRGQLTVWFSCTEKETWEAGKAYVNPPVEMAVNEGTEPVELVVVYLNVAAEQPPGVLPAIPEIPPAGCPAGMVGPAAPLIDHVTDHGV